MACLRLKEGRVNNTDQVGRSPAINGITSYFFFKDSSGMMGTDVLEVMLECFQEGSPLVACQRAATWFPPKKRDLD